MIEIQAETSNKKWVESWNENDTKVEQKSWKSPCQKQLPNCKLIVTVQLTKTGNITYNVRNSKSEVELKLK